MQKTGLIDNNVTIKHHNELFMSSTAVYSVDELYRYRLTRQWDEDLPMLGYILLNPSIATEIQLDSTIIRCQKRAVSWNYGGISIGNIFSWRDTDPETMKQAQEPIGQLNDYYLEEIAKDCKEVVFGWGNHGAHLNRQFAVIELLSAYQSKFRALDTNQDGWPGHPLYLSYDAELQPWSPPKTPS